MPQVPAALSKTAVIVASALINVPEGSYILNVPPVETALAVPDIKRRAIAIAFFSFVVFLHKFINFYFLRFLAINYCCMRPFCTDSKVCC